LNGNDPPEICKKNAQVAADNNRPDLEQAWHLASLILTQIIHNKRMSSERLLLPLGMQSKYVSKRRLSNNSYEDGFPSLFGRVNWGFHPLGRNIVQNLFNHFAELGDIQMFAMLSCVFREPFPPQKKFAWSHELYSRIIPDSLNSTMSHNMSYYNNYPRYNESYSIPNFVRNHYQYGYQTISTTFGQIFSESNSSKGSLGVINNPIDSCSNITISATPPTPSTLTYGNSDDSGGPIMIPSSSHSLHHQRRSTFGGTSKESNHFSSSVSTTASSPRLLRKGSPASYRLDSFGFSSNGYYGDRFMDVEKKIEKKSSDVNLVMMNCGEFDDERNPQTVTLLDDDRSTTALHDQYRLAYAEILYHWGLYEARAELLKFMSFVKTTVGSPLGEQQQPLEIGIHCNQCGAEIKAGSECGNCQRKRIGIKCSVCHRFVKGLTNFCIMCKHGGHTSHLREWFESESDECPTGCGCR
ncbi:9706_t:CDS:2, partial [Dentiscutata heterogama]